MHVLVYDPDTSRLQQTARALGGYQVTAVQRVEEILDVQDHQLLILHQDIQPSWVKALIQQWPSIIVVIGMERKPIDAIREWSRIGVRECLKYPIQMDRITRLLGPSLENLQSVLERVEPNLNSSVEEISATTQQIRQEDTQQPELQQRVTRTVTSSPLPWDNGITPSLQSPSTRVEEKKAPQVDPIEGAARKGFFKRKAHQPVSNREQLEQQLEMEIQDEEVYDNSFVPTRQETVVVTSARGGVGKTTIVYNLATLAANSGIKTAVVDIDPKGNIAQISNTKYRYTADQWDKIDPDNDGEKTVKDLLAPMQCGAFLLPSGKNVNGMTSQTFENVMTMLRRFFQLIIIDCEPRFTPTTLKAYQMASSLLVVIPDDVTTFGRTIEKINQMPEVDVEPQKIRMIVNRIENFDKDAEDILVQKTQCKVVAKIPYASDLRKLQKQGKPAVSNAKSGFTKELKKLLTKVILVQETYGKDGKRGFFSRLRKKSS